MATFWSIFNLFLLINSIRGQDPCDCYTTTLKAIQKPDDTTICYRYQVYFCDDSTDNTVVLGKGSASSICDFTKMSNVFLSFDAANAAVTYDLNERSASVKGISVSGLSDGNTFRICFKYPDVAGTLNGGSIGYGIGTEQTECNAGGGLLPDFCPSEGAANTLPDITPSPTTPSPITSSPTTAAPSTPALCDCFDFDLMCDPIPTGDGEEVCYYYRAYRTESAMEECGRKFRSFTLSGEECPALPASDLRDAITNFSPGCFEVDSCMSGGIEVNMRPDWDPTPGNYTRTTRAPRDGDKPRPSNDFEIFSICFNASSVYGTQSGFIDIEIGKDSASCPVGSILPRLCETDAPTPSPTDIIPCMSDDALNIGFLLDESASVSDPEWTVIKDFVTRIIEWDISPISSVKLWKYATYAFFQEIQDWTINDQSGGQSTLTSAIANTGWTYQGLTMTWDAVNRVLDDYWDYRFECTDGCDTRSDLFFLITDGAPTGEQVCPSMIDRVSQSSVDIVVIIIDNNGNFNASKIDCLDYNDGGADVIELPSFDSDAFEAIELRIREKTCSGQFPATASVRPPAGTQWVYEDGSVGLGPVPERNAGGGAGGGADPGANAKANGEVSDAVSHGTKVDGNNDSYTLEIVIGIVSMLLIIIAVGIYRWRLMKNQKPTVSIQEAPVVEDNDNEQVVYGRTGVDSNPVSPQSPSGFESDPVYQHKAAV